MIPEFDEYIEVPKEMIKVDTSVDADALAMMKTYGIYISSTIKPVISDSNIQNG